MLVVLKPQKTCVYNFATMSCIFQVATSPWHSHCLFGLSNPCSKPVCIHVCPPLCHPMHMYTASNSGVLQIIVRQVMTILGDFVVIFMYMYIHALSGV